MTSDPHLREYVRSIPLVDVHEHHIPEVYLRRDVGLLQILQQSYAGWTQARPYPLPSETREEDPMLTDSGGSWEDGSWKKIAAFTEHSGSNSFVRNVVGALTDLYELGEDGITTDNWVDLDEEIRRRHARPEWPREVLEKAHITHVITDPYTDPLLDAKSTFGEEYRAVMRINALALGWHPDAADHNGNSAHDFAERLGMKLRSFEDFEDLLRRLVTSLADRHQVALKNALAYDRYLLFDEPDEQTARRAWGKSNPTSEERKEF